MIDNIRNGSYEVINFCDVNEDIATEHMALKKTFIHWLIVTL
jgi:hypothetical protein